MTATVHKIKAMPKDKPRPQPAEPDIWRVYEREKSIIAATSGSVDEYENRIRNLIKRLGL